MPERVDFLRPRGAPALFPADSITWRVYKNPVSLFIGGIAAVLLELAEPRVRTGVWGHSIFPRDPVTRMRRTGTAALITVYAPAEAAKTMIRAVNRMHERVVGETPEGVRFSASEPELLGWVQVTASFAFLEAYARYACPLSAAERDRYYAESEFSAPLYGVVDAPRSRADQQAQFEAMRPKLEAHPIVADFLELVEGAPALPQPVRLIQPMMIRAGVELVPAWVRDILELDPRWRQRPGEAAFLRALGAIAERVPAPQIPAVKACLRMGLPWNYLYRGPPS